MHLEKLIQILEKHIPPATAPLLAQWLAEHKVKLIIKWDRQTKLGDYRSPRQHERHQITINVGLNNYAFLLTLVHEIAHLVTFNQYKHKADPHGIEWKNNFRMLMQPVFQLNVLPPDIHNAILNYMNNIKAGSCSDLQLTKVLNLYNTVPKLFVDQLSIGSKFTLQDNRSFIIKKRLRKNFLCTELISGKDYIVPPSVTVKHYNA